MTPAFQLRNYQRRVVNALWDYFNEAAALNSAGQAFERVTARENEGRTISYHPAPAGLEKLPYVCLKVPTGGGKTLLAAHAVGLAVRGLLKQEHGVALWLVPSTTIEEQTLRALRDPRHPYRRALEERLGPAVEVVDSDEALRLSRSVFEGASVVVVATIQAFRVDKTEGRKVYEQNGQLTDHFEFVPREQWMLLECDEGGRPVPSLANALRLRRPVVIVDEAHNARTDLSFETLARVKPSAVVEFTATPLMEGEARSNILVQVSALELATEEMIKLPVLLKVDKDWQRTLADAVAAQKRLEQLARDEAMKDVAGGRPMRPIVLVQAEPERQGRLTLGVERVVEALIERCGVPKEQVIRATGKKDELEGVDLKAPDCPVRFIVTVAKLREGWDCPWAYVLASVAPTSSQTAVEQILGRVMRLPDARRRTQDELNQAYAFVASEQFREAQDALIQGLRENGFEKQTAEELVQRAREEEQADWTPVPGSADLFAAQVTIRMKRPVELSALSAAARAVVFVSPRGDELVVQNRMDAEVTAELEKHFREAGDEQAARQVVQAAEASKSMPPARRLSPSERGVEFAVPVLALRFEDGELEPLEPEHFIPESWNLKGCDFRLTPGEYSPPGDSAGYFRVEANETGQLVVRSDEIRAVQTQLATLTRERSVTEASLADWLDRNFPHIDLAPDKTQPWLLALVRALTQERGIELTALERDKLRLVEAVRRKVDEYRKAARKHVQKGLFADDATLAGGSVAVSPESVFRYGGPFDYPAREIYRGNVEFRKHYFPVVEKMNGEELECAQTLDQLPEVECWVRNISNEPTRSFWIATTTDRFYPDFVAKLKDGRYLAVEHKGDHIATAEDAEEKRKLGELWERTSHGRCLFVMTEKREFGRIGAKVRGN